MTRLWRIAAREYLAYVRTPGFWLSILLLPVGFSVIGAAPILMRRATPPPTLAIVDLSGRNLASPVAHDLANGEANGRPVVRLVPAPGAPYTSPAEAAQRLKPYLSGPRRLPDGEELDVAAILRPSGATAAVDVWTREVADRSVAGAVSAAVDSALRRQALTRAGVDPAVVAAIEGVSAPVTDFSPKAVAGKVALRDRLPGVVGFAMGFLLWMSVLTGAGMLLGSIIEEKSSRILEILLSSASVPEIMAGKILGVAAVTGTVLTFWMAIGTGVVALRFPSVGADLANILFVKGYLLYFVAYFVAGYLMFATLYVTIGAFCESPREAQTLLGPMMVVMSMPLVFMGEAYARPDAPLLTVLSFFPLFTPFIMAARVATSPPVWQIVGTLSLMAGLTAVEVWVAIPAFRSGALTSGRFQLKAFVASLVRRGD